MRRFLKHPIFLSCVVLASLGAAGWAWLANRDPNHFAEVNPGVLYRSGMPEPDSLARVVETHGIRTVVTLNNPVDDESRSLHRSLESFCEAHGIRRIYAPMGAGKPPTDAQVDRWLEIVDDEANHPILVHCRHGVIRTGMMVAVYQMEFLGLDNASALADMPAYGHDLDSARRKPIRDFIRHYEPRREHSVPPR